MNECAQIKNILPHSSNKHPTSSSSPHQEINIKQKTRNIIIPHISNMSTEDQKGNDRGEIFSDIEASKMASPSSVEEAAGEIRKVHLCKNDSILREVISGHTHRTHHERFICAYSPVVINFEFLSHQFQLYWGHPSQKSTMFTCIEPQPHRRVSTQVSAQSILSPAVNCTSDSRRSQTSYRIIWILPKNREKRTKISPWKVLYPSSPCFTSCSKYLHHWLSHLSYCTVPAIPYHPPIHSKVPLQRRPLV